MQRYALYHKSLSKRARYATSLSVFVLAATGAGVFIWLHSRTEVCEFLARPSARLYIDRQFVSEEIPPIYRAKLRIGKHFVRFIGPEDVPHETTIDVTKGHPTLWVMNFIEGRLHTRVQNRDEETK